MSTWRERIIEALGDAANRSGVFSETAGRIYGVLYLSPGPLSLDEIGQQVGTSKGNASVQVRELLDLGMVRKVWVRRSRRDYYEATTDLWAIASEVIGRRIQYEAEALLGALDGAEQQFGDGAGGDLLKTRVGGMRSFLQSTIGLLEGFRQGKTMSSQALRNVAK